MAIASVDAGDAEVAALALELAGQTLKWDGIVRL